MPRTGDALKAPRSTAGGPGSLQLQLLGGTGGVATLQVRTLTLTLALTLTLTLGGVAMLQVLTLTLTLALTLT